MHFKYLAVLISLLCFQCKPVDISIKAPFKEVDIRILERHHPDELLILDASGRLLLDSSTVTLDKQDIKISLNGKSITCTWGDTARKTSHAHFDSSSPLHIKTGTQKKIDRTYSGSLEIGITGDEIILVNTTTVDDYVRGAARSELGPLLSGKMLNAQQRRELIHAQETCIRSAIFYSENRHDTGPWQFCDLTHCFHYEGIGDSMEAAQEPAACMVSGTGKPVETFFHSTCGGLLTPPSLYWPSHGDTSSYRRGPDIIDGYDGMLCVYSPHATWSAHITREQMGRVLKVHDVQEIRSHETYGRIDYVEFRPENEQGFQKIPVAEFMSRIGRELGWNVIKSNYFTIREKQGNFAVNGKGLGHGIGFCQYGAASLAMNGYTWQQILRFYFPGAHIAKVIK